MKKITLLSLAILAGAALPPLQAAAQDGRPARPDFAAVDADGDGAVTPAELRATGEARRDARFAQIDADGDGMLNRDELLARATAQAGARVDRMIAARDGDDDGLLSAEELAARPTHGEGAREEGEHRRGKRGHGGGHGRHHGGDRSAAMFERADTDGDGSLSPEEWTATGPRGRN